MKSLHPVALQKFCNCHSGDRRIMKCVVRTPREHGTACRAVAAKRQRRRAGRVNSRSMRRGRMLQ
jgi:hypothetical protein